MSQAKCNYTNSPTASRRMFGFRLRHQSDLPGKLISAVNLNVERTEIIITFFRHLMVLAVGKDFQSGWRLKLPNPNTTFKVV